MSRINEALGKSASFNQVEQLENENSKLRREIQNRDTELLGLYRRLLMYDGSCEVQQDRS